MKQPPKEPGDDEWALFKVGGIAEVCGCTNEAELRQEYADLDRRELFVARALEQGKLELDAVHGRISREICAAVRPQFVERIREILGGIKVVCEGNGALEKLRADLEQKGVRTDSLPYAILDVGVWDDHPYGGSEVSNYRRHIAEHYPETEPTRVKRRELDSKAQSHEERNL
jgi:hypothetical protein